MITGISTRTAADVWFFREPGLTRQTDRRNASRRAPSGFTETEYVDDLAGASGDGLRAALRDAGLAA